MEALGIQPGWRCWEVGAGGPSIARWLAERAAPGRVGQVVATDIDVSWIGDGLGPAVEVRQHDVAADDPPGGGFDLVHARLVLVHTPAREQALRRMVSALRPGGWLLLEDFDVAWQPLGFLDPYQPEHELANKVRRGFCTLLGQRGVDLEYGRKLPRLLAAQGLEDVAADGYAPVAHETVSALEASNVMQVRDALIAQGHASAEEIAAGSSQGHGTAGTGHAEPPWAAPVPGARQGCPWRRVRRWSAGVRLRSAAGSRPAASRRRPAAGQARCAAQGA